MAITKAVALYDYEVQSTNDLALKAGDVVTVIDRSDSDWWLGEIGETQGYFPANYVELLGDEPPAPRGAASVPPKPVRSTKPQTVVQPQHVQVTIQETNEPGLAGPVERKTPASKMVSAAAAQASAHVSSAPLVSKTKIGLWASNMAILTGYVMIIMAICGIPWSARYHDSGDYDAIVSAYSLVVGVGILTYEYTFGDARGPSKVPTRGIIFARYASQLKFESP